MKRVVITGATSMIGLAILDICIKNKINATCILRENSLKKHIIPSSPYVSSIICNINNYSQLAEKIEKPQDIFFHFAWTHTDNASRNLVDMQHENVHYSLEALHAAVKMNCSRFIGAGSQAEYGRVEGKISPTMKVSPESAYGVAKYAAGKLGAILAEQLGIDFFWPRIFSTYGINDMPSTMIMYCLKELMENRSPELTGCEQQWDYLNCKDAARAFFLIAKKGNPGNIYNIGGGKTHTLKYYVEILRDQINPHLSLGIGKRPYADKQVMHLCADISNLQQDTGFLPQIEFIDGIKEIINWYRGNKK